VTRLRRTLRLRTRIALLVAVAVGLTVAATSVAAFFTVRSQLYAALDQSLLGQAQAAINSPLADPTRLVQVPSAALEAGDVRIALLEANGTAFVAAGGLAPPLADAELAVAQGRSNTSVRGARGTGESFRVVAVAVRPGLALVLAQSTATLESTLSALGLVLLIVGVLGVGLAAVVGLLVARASLRPVEDLTAATEHITATEQLTPIPVSGDDELARLTTSFNAMLAALEASRTRQRRLVADAGHELRTPLTSLRTNLDLLAQSERPGVAVGLEPGERAALLADVRAQVEELGALVGDLVELSRDAPPATRVEQVDLAEVVDRSVARVRRRAPGVVFDVTADSWAVVGDSTALERAVTNLLDNAAKWSPAGGTVTVALSDGRLTVTDQGPGISDDDLPHVFDRFYRSDAARSMPGSGLGLSIVAQTVQRHGGTVAAGRCAGGGAQLVVRLPGSGVATPSMSSGAS
jgi:two-component system sensor histidine kinase MprB